MILFREGQVLAGGLVGSYLSHALESQMNTFGAYVLLLAVFHPLPDDLHPLLLRLGFSPGSPMPCSHFVRALREFFLKRRERARKKKVREDHVEREKVKPRRR